MAATNRITGLSNTWTAVTGLQNPSAEQRFSIQPEDGGITIAHTTTNSAPTIPVGFNCSIGDTISDTVNTGEYLWIRAKTAPTGSTVAYKIRYRAV